MILIIGFISDAHGNAAALAAGLRALRGQGAEQVYFLGDALGYIPGTDALELLARESIAAIRGNHEAMCLGLQSTGNNSEIYRLPELGKLPDGLRTFLFSMPESREILDGCLLMVHGSPVDPTFGYVYPDTDLDGVAGPWNWVVMGHTHRPFVRVQAETTFVNCGSCAFPRDGIAKGAAALIDTVTRKAEVIRFDIQAAVSEVLARKDLHSVTRVALEKLRDK